MWPAPEVLVHVSSVKYVSYSGPGQLSDGSDALPSVALGDYPYLEQRVEAFGSERPNWKLATERLQVRLGKVGEVAGRKNLDGGEEHALGLPRVGERVAAVCRSIAPRHQVTVYQRSEAEPRTKPAGRLLWTWVPGSGSRMEGKAGARVKRVPG